MFGVGVCSLRYPACNVHVPYCHPWLVRIYLISRINLINGKIFVKTLLYMKRLLWSYPQTLSETVHILRITKRDMIKHLRRYSCKYSLFLSGVNKTWIFWTDLRKTLKYQISWNSAQWEPSCFMRTYRQTYRHDETNSRFSRFCERN
jgi:hypothetical protein